MKETDDSARACIDALMKPGGVVVLRTDTLYGIVARADDEHAVANVYQARHRNQAKSCIVLVASSDQAYGHHGELRRDVTEHSDEPTSFLASATSAPLWLLRQGELLAYRVPDKPWLKRILEVTGPLIAPSANLEGKPPARTIDEAQGYFGDAVQLYIDGGEVPESTPPSRIVHIHADGTIEYIR